MGGAWAARVNRALTGGFRSFSAPTATRCGYGLAVERSEFFDPRPEHMPLPVLVCRTGEAVSRFRRGLAPDGLTSTALAVLAALADGSGGVSHRELAGVLGLTPATLTPVVDALERRGELRRERDDADRRIVRLWISEPGLRRLDSAFAQLTRALWQRLPEPSEQEALAVRRYLLDVLAAMSPDWSSPDRTAP